MVSHGVRGGVRAARAEPRRDEVACRLPIETGQADKEIYPYLRI